jgi:hypothetical protein
MNENFIPYSGFITSVDDPEKLGRVKIHCELIDGTNPSQETIWVNILKGPEGFGHDSPSPPQVGTRIIAHVNKTNPSIRQVVHIVGSQKQKANPEMPGNMSLNFIRVPYENVSNKNISGPAKVEQTPETNGRGSLKQKVPVSTTGQKTELTIAERHELQTLLSANPHLITVAAPLKNVATALTPDASILSSSILSSLPGVNLSLANLLDHMTGDHMKELEKSMNPQALISLKNMVTTASSFIPSQVDGFMQTINTANPATLGANILNKLKTIKNPNQVKDVVNDILTNEDVKNTSALDSVEIKIDSAFGEITKLLSVSGELIDSENKIIESLKQIFGNISSGLTSLGGEAKFLENSKIPNDLLERMNPEKQKEFKEMFEKLSGINNIPRTKIESKIKTLKNKLES